MLDDDTNEDDSEGFPFSLVLAPDVLKVLGVPSKSGGRVSVREEQLIPRRPGSSPLSGCSASL